MRRLEHLCQAWFEVSPVGPEEMGRAAAKVETLTQALSSLESRARALAPKGREYFPQRVPDEIAERQVQSTEDEAAKRLHLDTGMTTFKPVDPSRLGFVGRPSFNPGPYLDPVSKRIFDDPLSTRLDPSNSPGKPPKLRVRCSRADKIRLFTLLDSCGRLLLFPSSLVTPQFGSGLFTVVKSLEKDRLIMDLEGPTPLSPRRGGGSAALVRAMHSQSLSLNPTKRS